MAVERETERGRESGEPAMEHGGWTSIGAWCARDRA